MHFSLQQVFLGAALAGTAAAAALSQRTQSCNGSPDICDRLYSNVTYVGSHDSAFVGILPTQNQFISVAKQLSLGVRFLQAQSHDKDGVIELCHTTCLEEDAGTLATYLATIKTFLDDNADEVVTLLLTNGDSIAIADYGTIFESAGLDTYAYAPSGTPALADWPTLGTLISSGKRLIVFMGVFSLFLLFLPGSGSSIQLTGKQITTPTHQRLTTSSMNSHTCMKRHTT